MRIYQSDNKFKIDTPKQVAESSTVEEKYHKINTNAQPEAFSTTSLECYWKQTNFFYHKGQYIIMYDKQKHCPRTKVEAHLYFQVPDNVSLVIELKSK